LCSLFSRKRSLKEKIKSTKKIGLAEHLFFCRLYPKRRDHEVIGKRSLKEKIKSTKKIGLTEHLFFSSPSPKKWDHEVIGESHPW